MNTRQYQDITIRVYFDPSEHEAPGDWSWGVIIDGEADLLGCGPVNDAKEEKTETDEA